MSGIGEVLDREYRLEHRLQALVWTPGLRRVHQQKLIIRGLLDFDQVRHFADFLDVPEHLASALAAVVGRRTPMRAPDLRLVFSGRRRRPLVIKPSPAAAPQLSWPLRMTF